jgi:septum formation protein
MVDPARLDEDAIKDAFPREPGRCAVALAAAKAGQVSPRHPGRLVIGADQTLDCDGIRFDKPRDAAEARRQLASLRGRGHALHAAVAVMRDGDLIWQHVEPARLWMREFSDAFLDDYLAVVGEEAYATVGSYAIEGVGVQLFERIEGDYFTILGLPLLPLLGFLRGRGAVAS